MRFRTSRGGDAIEWYKSFITGQEGRLPGWTPPKRPACRRSRRCCPACFGPPSGSAPERCCFRFSWPVPPWRKRSSPRGSSACTPSPRSGEASWRPGAPVAKAGTSEPSPACCTCSAYSSSVFWPWTRTGRRGLPWPPLPQERRERSGGCWESICTGDETQKAAENAFTLSAAFAFEGRYRGFSAFLFPFLLLLRFFLRAGDDVAHGGPVEGQFHFARLQHNLVVRDRFDHAVQAADRHHLVAFLQGAEHVVALPLPFLLRADHQKVQNREHRDKRQERNQKASPACRLAVHRS